MTSGACRKQITALLSWKPITVAQWQGVGAWFATLLPRPRPVYITPELRAHGQDSPAMCCCCGGLSRVRFIPVPHAGNSDTAVTSVRRLRSPVVAQASTIANPMLPLTNPGDAIQFTGKNIPRSSGPDLISTHLGVCHHSKLCLEQLAT